MTSATDAHRFLEQEALALLTRLNRVESFALRETSVPAAAISYDAQVAIERFLGAAHSRLHGQIERFLRWLRSSQGSRAKPYEKQRRFTFLRLRFVSMLSQFDMFSDVLTQRSEHDTGVWLSGLDAVAADALRVPGGFIQPPPVACYLAPGHGAAIRRAKTPLPGGGNNPIAIIRIPRERMIGSGVASSLVHEVGHQAAGQLELEQSIRPLLVGLQRGGGNDRLGWWYWNQWISEILADFWSVARLGVTATIGLMSVVSLPRFFVFRITADDPHPPPAIRVKVSCALGKALYPDRQWDEIVRLWDALYPATGLNPTMQALYDVIERSIPSFVTLLTSHRPPALRGASLGEVLTIAGCRPNQLRATYRAWAHDPNRMRTASPSQVFAVVGQAKTDGVITPSSESRILERMLKSWALQSTYARPAAGMSAMPRLPSRAPRAMGLPGFPGQQPPGRGLPAAVMNGRATG